MRIARLDESWRQSAIEQSADPCFCLKMKSWRQTDVFSATPSRSALFTGVAVHLFTAVGAGLGFMALVAAFDRRFDLCFAWLGAALFVDGADGPLARRAKVTQTAPFIDGALLDLIVDFLTYVVAPLFALWRSNLMPQDLALACSIVAMVGSALYFSYRHMKTADLWFRGFPACWNIVVFYIFVFRFPALISAGILLGGAALMFAPVYSVHPLRVSRWRAATLAVSLIWLACAGVLIWRDFAPTPPAALGLAFAALYFIGLSLWRGLRSHAWRAL